MLLAASASANAPASATASVNATLLDDDENSREATLIFVGPTTSGKSSLIYSYMYKDKDDTPKTTTSLEYKFTRSSVVGSVSDEKSLSHFWELGGGRTFDRLLDVIINEENIRDTFVAVTLDLQRLSRVADDAVHWLELIKRKVSEVLGSLKSKRNSKIAFQLEENAKKRFPENHADLRSISLIPIPVLLVANKWDRCVNTNPDGLKVLSKTLRSIAHSYGASLMYTSTKEKDSLKAFRNRISRHVLNQTGGKVSAPQVDPLVGINVTAGTDTFASIGDAPGGSARNNKDGWVAYFSKTFPPQDGDSDGPSISSKELSSLPSEPTVDAMIAQKTEDLVRLVNEVELRRKLANVDQTSLGSSSGASTSASASLSSNQKR